MNRISSETKLLMAVSFLFAFCPVGLGELNSTTQIKSQKTTFEAGEPLVIEVFRLYHETGDAIKGAFPDSMRIVVERTDGQNTSSSYILRPKNIIRDNKKGILQCKLVAWYDGWGEYPRKLIFSIPGKYQLYIKAYPSSILKVNVLESSAKTKMGMSLVADPNDWLSFTDGVYDKNKPARMAKLAEIAEQCDNTVLGQIAAARLAIEYYEEYTSKNQDVEALMAKKTSIRLSDPLLIKLDKYMKKASKLNVEMPIREEIISKRSFTEFFKGDIERANLLLKELKTRYPKGRYGKRASGFEFQINNFSVLGVSNQEDRTKPIKSIYQREIGPPGGKIIRPSKDLIPRKVFINTSNEWVIGNKFWVALDVINKKNNGDWGPQHESNLFDFRGYEYSLKNIKTNKVFKGPEYFPPYSDEMGFDTDGQPGLIQIPRYGIRKHGLLRLLIQIPWPSGENIEPGEYEFQIVYYEMNYEFARIEIPVTVRQVAGNEKAVHDSLKIDKNGTPQAELDVLRKVTLPESLRKKTGLGFEKLLRLVSETETSQMDPNDLDIDPTKANKDLPEMFAPELGVLKYEVLKAKGKDKEAKQLRKVILKKYPGIKYRLVKVDEGYGPVKTLKKIYLYKKTMEKRRIKWEKKNSR